MPFGLPETSFTPQPPAEAENMAESLLLKQAVNGDREAFARLYSLYYRKLVPFVYQFVQDVQVAEDIVQNTFMQAQKNLHTYQDRGFSFGAYLHTIARNLATNYHKRERSRIEPQGIEAVLDKLQLARQPTKDTLPQSVVDAEQIANLRAAIAALPERQRTVVQRKLETGWKESNKKIAEKLGTTESAVKSLYSNALANLRALIAKLQG